MSNENENENVLSKSNNPYLIQHADNPVNWKMWEEETFQLAAQQQKPLFISIGYSTCHWCHVMARESFEDEEVSELLNTHFISIKVDREERPDIDSYYMDIALKLNGSGGWPLTVVATPEGKPFFTATYLPKHGLPQRAGMMEILPEIDRLWRSEREKVLNSADSIVKAVQKSHENNNVQPLGIASTEELEIPKPADVIRSLHSSFDWDAGGFGLAPKFPQAYLLSFLLQQADAAESKDQVLQMVEHTLDRMRAGGIYDHIGFGFHRYATDQYWKVPHFEKMLYDQAELALLYVDAYATTQHPGYARTVEEIFQFLEDNMRSEEGGFYSALDAESEGKEGLFYLWSYEELQELLEENAQEMLSSFHVKKEGNWSDPVNGKAERSNILYTDTLKNALEPAQNWQQLRSRLYTQRNLRIPPTTDDKILTSWNALTVRALARAGKILNSDVYTTRSKKTAEFLLSAMRQENGALLHSYRNGVAQVEGQLEDYSYFISALIELYETTYITDYLSASLNLMNIALKLFEAEDGGFYGAAHNNSFIDDDPGSNPAAPINLSFKPLYDGAIPSASSIMVENLELLFRLTGEPHYRNTALRALQAHQREITATPSACSLIISTLDRMRSENTREIVIAGEGHTAKDMLKRVRTLSLPNYIVHHKTSKNAEALSELAPFTGSLSPDTHSGAAAYVCSGFSCDRPVKTASELDTMLRNA